MLADVKFFDFLMNIQNTPSEIIAHCGNVQLLILECKLPSVILIAAQLMQPFSALSATQSGIVLTKRSSFLGNGFEVVIASVEPYCFAWRSSWVRRDAFWDSPLLLRLLLFLFEIEYDSRRLSLSYMVIELVGSHNRKV